MTKRCGHCKQEKPVEMFYKNRRTKDGFDWTCKECHKITDHKRRTKEQVKTERDRQRFSGNRQKALERDGYKCVICGANETLSVHHMDCKSKHTPRCLKNNKLENLVTLCFVCHGKLHASPNFEKEKNYLLQYMNSINEENIPLTPMFQNMGE